MTAKSAPINLADLSPEQRAQLLEELMQEEQAKEDAKKQKRKDYEANKEKFLKEVEKRAKKAQQDLIELKSFIFKGAKALQAEMYQLGEIRKNAKKGGFTIKNQAENFKLGYQPRGIKEFDETVAVAEEMLRVFLEKTVKKTNKLHFNMIESILQKSNGEYNPDLVNRLVDIQDQINSPEFDEVVELFQKAWKEVDTTTYVNLYNKTSEQNSWEHLCLYFAKLPIH